jgi:Ni/Co efflux regulator RcnB
MKPYIRAAACTAALFIATAGFAQSHDRFDDHDRQVTQDWYQQHQHQAPKGWRSQDRLSSEQEGRLQTGHRLDPDLRKRSYSVPSDLRRHLPPAPRNHHYVTIGGRLVLVDNHDVVRDVLSIRF